MVRRAPPRVRRTIFRQKSVKRGQFTREKVPFNLVRRIPGQESQLFEGVVIYMSINHKEINVWK
jgi:hypothetical protein